MGEGEGTEKKDDSKKAWVFRCISFAGICFMLLVYKPMRLKARGLVQHCGWLEKNGPATPAGVILY